MSCPKLLVVFCAVLCAVSADTSVHLRRLVHEFIDTQYAGEVDIGNQRFLLVFDTSSPNVIIPSQECFEESCDCSIVQKYVGPTNRNGPLLTVNFFDTGEATGYASTNSLTIVNLTSPNQGIILAETLGMEVCRLGASGVVGLAPPPASTSPSLDTVVANFANLSLIPNVFSIHHARYEDGEHFGELVLGGSDTTYVDGKFTSVSLVEETSWKFPIDDVRIGTIVVTVNAVGLVDTSKNIILGPTRDVNRINAEIGCTPTQINARTNLCLVNCTDIANLPDFAFTISGRRFELTPDVYIQRNGDRCYSGFVSNNDNFFMIGDIFIDHFYSEFNWERKQMRFAKAIEVAH